MLPFGLSVAGHTFCRVAAVPATVIRRSGLVDALINYVDDFAASVGTVRDEARARAVVAVLEDFGFIVNWPRTDLSMATSLEVLGFIIDTEHMTYDVPERRAKKLAASARAVLDALRGSGRGRVQARALAKVVGQI